MIFCIELPFDLGISSSSHFWRTLHKCCTDLHKALLEINEFRNAHSKLYTSLLDNWQGKIAISLRRSGSGKHQYYKIYSLHRQKTELLILYSFFPFWIICKARLPFPLGALEAVNTNTTKSTLCRQSYYFV